MRRNKLLLILFFLFVANIGEAQLLYYSLDNVRLDSVKNRELKFGSVLVSESDNYYYYDKTFSYKFIKGQDCLPYLLTEYTFSDLDSSLIKIQYEWDVFNFNRSDNNKQSSTLHKDMIDKFTELQNVLEEIYGEPIIEVYDTDLTELNKENGFRRVLEWNNKHNIKISALLVLSNFYERNENIVTNPTHRIRLIFSKN